MGLKKIGIFGGSFDPVHNGHIEIGLLAIEQLDLDILLYVPVFDQWMKKSGPYAKPKDRMEMLEVATEKYSNLLVSDLDIKRNKSFMIGNTKSDEMASLKSNIKFEYVTMTNNDSCGTNSIGSF